MKKIMLPVSFFMLTFSTYSSAAVTKEECLATDQYWSSNSCSPAFNACNELATYKRPFRNIGALQNLSDPPQTLCYFDNELNTVPYDGCQMKQSGSINKLTSGSWQSDYVFTGKPCNKGTKNADGSITPPPREDIKKPEFEDVFQASKQQTCRVSNAYVDSKKKYHELPRKVWSSDACTMTLVSEVGRNSVNDCTRYKYSGSVESSPIGSYSIDDMLKNSQTCNYSQRLDCNVDEYPSSDGTKCISNKPTGENLPSNHNKVEGNMSNLNPYRTYSLKEVFHSTYYANNPRFDYITENFAYEVPQIKSGYMPDILKFYLPKVKNPSFVKSGNYLYRKTVHRYGLTLSCTDDGLYYSSTSTSLTISHQGSCFYVNTRTGQVYGESFLDRNRILGITLNPSGFDYKPPTSNDDSDTGDNSSGGSSGNSDGDGGGNNSGNGGDSSTCDPSKFVCSNDNYLKNISDEITSLADDAKKLRESREGAESDNSAVLDSVSSNLTTAVSDFFTDSDKTIEGLNTENTDQGNDLVKKASPVLTGVTDKIGKLFKVDSCEPINLSFGEKKIYVTCEDLKPLRDFLSWAFIIFTLIYIYQYFLERSAK